MDLLWEHKNSTQMQQIQKHSFMCLLQNISPLWPTPGYFRNKRNDVYFQIVSVH